VIRHRSVAVVLSNYNHAQYLPEALEAIGGQTRPPEQIVIIDDASTDNSVELIQRFADQHPTVQFVQNARNLGLQESIGRVVPLVKADYLVWTASDDRLLPNLLERSMALLDRYPDAGLCFSELALIRGDNGEIQRFAAAPGMRHIFDLSDLPEYMTPQQVRRRMRREYLPITSNSVVVRRDALLKSGGYPKALEWHSDSFAYLVVALRYGACVVPETLAYLRGRTDSYSQIGMRDQIRQRAVLTAMLEILARPEYRDIRRAFRKCPSNFSPWRTAILRLQLERPRDWDLLLPYLLWKIRDYKRGRRLPWHRALFALGWRLVRAVAAEASSGPAVISTLKRPRGSRSMEDTPADSAAKRVP
jgi:glycosyltransferase involved in cell wall biosynthesis